MRKIISSIDIDSDSIKLVVGEFFENRLHILSASKVINYGIEKGKVVDEESVVDSIKKAIQEVSNELGVEIEKCILGLDMTGARLAKSAGAVKIKNEQHKIMGSDVNDVMIATADGKVLDNYVLVSVVPVEFTVDGDRAIKRPIGIESENLGLKSIIVSSPKDYVSSMLDIVNKAGLKVIDVVPNAMGDYYMFKNQTTASSVGAIINLGSEASSVTVFNKGIITNTSVFPLGSKNIIKDIAFVHKIPDAEAQAIYQDLVLANGRLANPNEYRIVVNLDGEELRLNQYEVSEIASYRIEEILNLAKKQTNVLTKREISYIIVTGSLSELRDFNLALENVFGKKAILGKMNILGVRDNSYSSTVGIIKYFDEKLELKGKSVTMVSEKSLSNVYIDSSQAESKSSLLGKVFGYFFDN